MFRSTRRSSRSLPHPSSRGQHASGRICAIASDAELVPAELDDRAMQVVQGSRPGGALATFYFDSQSGLLVRLVRYANSRVGRLPTQIDYADYRDVSGIKIPFRLTVTWLDGLEKIELTDVQVNVPIDAAKFAKPAAPKQ